MAVRISFSSEWIRYIMTSASKINETDIKTDNTPLDWNDHKRIPNAMEAIWCIFTIPGVRHIPFRKPKKNLRFNSKSFSP